MASRDWREARDADSARIISVKNLTKTYASGFHGAQEHQSRDPARGDLRSLRAQRGRQDDAHRRHLRHRESERAARCWRTGTTSSPTIAQRGRRSGSFPKSSRPICSRPSGPRSASAAASSASQEPGAYREGPARPFSVGQERQQDHDALGRHEASGPHRQGALARAARSCFSTSRPPVSMSSCGATCGRWFAPCATPA